MLSEYFMKKVNTEKFCTHVEKLFDELKDKKIILYGAGEGFEYLFDKYPFKNLNVVAIADKKFEQETVFKGFKAISPNEIQNQNYDFVLITNEDTPNIIKYLDEDLNIELSSIKFLIEDSIPQERESFMYLQSSKFQKRLEDLNRKLKNKKIVIYGAGVFFEAIKENYDLSRLNIIGISDKKFINHAPEETFLGYSVLSPEEIKDVNPDYVLVSTKFFIKVIEDLHYNLLKGSKIKIKPLLKKSFITLINEIWC